MPPELFDIGLNLTHDSFDQDRAAVLERALASGVTRMLVTGSTARESVATLQLVRRWPQHLRATAGVHPHHADGVDESTAAQLSDLLRQSEVLAVGECGLDFFRNFSTHAAQERVFRMQLELAGSIAKPLFLHQRDAHDPFLAILKEYGSDHALRGVAHCFTGNEAQARDYLDLGLHIGITGWICDERRGQQLRATAAYIPRDKLLIETDAPYLLPRDLQPRPKSRRNEPMYLPQVLKVLAHCRNEDAADLAQATTQNAVRLFGW
jgi:TatD DNase family protein